jgi:hypothetical protein
MKHTLLRAGILGLALVFGLVLMGCGDGGGDDSPNSFVGTWSGDQGTLTVTDSTWEIGNFAKGTYTYNGNAATFTATQFWQNEAWADIPADNQTTTSVTLSGNTLTGTFNDTSYIFTKG